VNVLGDETLTQQCANMRKILNSLEGNGRIEDVTVTGLNDIKVALESDLEDAVKAAEKRLTGVGRRKLEVA